MMAQPQVIQGTWEEIAAHAEEFEGRNDLLLVIPARKPETSEQNRNGSKEKTLVEQFAGRVGRLSFDPPDLAAKAEEYFGQIVTEKDAQREAKP